MIKRVVATIQIMKMTSYPSKPYPSYKPSGVAWLGDVPAHWEVLPNRAIFVEVNERNHPQKEMLSVTIAEGVIRQSTLLADKSKKDASRLDRSAYKLVRPGDIAYNKMRAWQGAIGMSEYIGIVSPAYVVQRPRNGVNSRYLHYLLRTPAFATEAECWSYGIASDMWSLRPEHFKMIYSCVPPLAEQAAIVAYLNHTDGRIRRYLRSRERLIELLKEYRQAVVHEVVTRGLDPDVSLKPSGVEWLGEVPTHWEVRRLKNICRLAYGDSLSSENRVGGNVSVYGSNGQVGVHSNPNTSGQCLIIGRKGSFGKVHYSAEPVFAIDTTFFVDRRHTGANIRWLYYLLGWLQLDAVSKDSAVPGLNREDAYQHIGFYPPLAEQAAIAAYLDKQTAAIDAAITRARREIDLLSEYRTRLIADVVTGQVDVREVAD